MRYVSLGEVIMREGSIILSVGAVFRFQELSSNVEWVTKYFGHLADVFQCYTN